MLQEYEEMPVLKLCAMDWEDRHDLMDSFYRTKRAKEVRTGLACMHACLLPAADVGVALRLRCTRSRQMGFEV